MPADRDRAARRADRRRRLRLADRDEPERRARDRSPGARAICRRSPRSGPGTAETLREQGIEPAFVPRVSSQDGLLAEFPRPAGRVLFAAAENARRRPIDELGADFVALYRTRLLRPGPARGRRRRARVRLGGARVRGARRRPGGVDRPADERGARGVASGRGRGRDARPRRARRRRATRLASRLRRSSPSSPTSGSRTTSSARATA